MKKNKTTKCIHSFESIDIRDAYEIFEQVPDDPGVINHYCEDCIRKLRCKKYCPDCKIKCSKERREYYV